MKYLVFCVLAFLFVSCSILSSKKNDLPDYEIVKLHQPEWDDSTRIFISIRNNGAYLEKEVSLKVFDVDATLEEAKQMGATKEQLEIFKENNSLAKEGEKDIDKYFEIVINIPPLKKDEVYKAEVNLKHWVYDGNCEIGAYIDFNNEIEEFNELNNKAWFFAFG